MALARETADCNVIVLIVRCFGEKKVKLYRFIREQVFSYIMHWPHVQTYVQVPYALNVDI